MKKPNVLMLNGKPFDTRPIKPCILRIKAFLESLPDNELLTAAELSKRATVSTRHYAQDEELLKFRLRILHPRPLVVWGNAKTITGLAKNKELTA